MAKNGQKAAKVEMAKLPKWPKSQKSLNGHNC